MKQPWEGLLLQHAEEVFRYLRKIGATKEDAEDAVQEAIMKTIECIAQIELTHLRAWLYKVAIHRYYTLYKKQKKSIYLTDDDAALLTSNISIEADFLTKERQTTIYNALQKIQPNFQQLLIMKYFSELSYKDMAAILDVSEPHIKTYLQRARKALRKRLEDLDE
ncbi:MAG: RNA polymerase sigma factor [Solibacillus sp.]